MGNCINRDDIDIDEMNNFYKISQQFNLVQYPNINGSCYINAVLYAMQHMNKLKQIIDFSQSNEDQQTGFLYILNQLLSGNNQSEQLIGQSIENLKEVFDLSKEKSGDSEVFFISLLNKLCQEKLDSQNLKLITNQNDDPETQEIYKYQKQQHNQSIIIDLFLGIYDTECNKNCISKIQNDPCIFFIKELLLDGKNDQILQQVIDQSTGCCLQQIKYKSLPHYLIFSIEYKSKKKNGKNIFKNFQNTIELKIDNQNIIEQYFILGIICWNGFHYWYEGIQLDQKQKMQWVILDDNKTIIKQDFKNKIKIEAKLLIFEKNVDKKQQQK